MQTITSYKKGDKKKNMTDRPTDWSIGRFGGMTFFSYFHIGFFPISSPCGGL